MLSLLIKKYLNIPSYCNGRNRLFEISKLVGLNLKNQRTIKNFENNKIIEY